MRTIRDIFRSHAVFDVDGRHTNGTDKQSNHNYGDAYESLFIVGNSVSGLATSTSRNDVRLVMEVGVADGSCLRAWREVFPNATIVGMDIHHSDKAHGERIEFHLGDQTSKADCERAAARRLFDMIVEDATHRLDYTLQTLLYLWPFVKPGGLYVVEEWDGISGIWHNVQSLFPQATVVNTVGPFGGSEPLVVFRKPT